MAWISVTGSELPALAAYVTLDGGDAAGIDGSVAPAGARGLVLDGSDGSIVEDFHVRRFPMDGIAVLGGVGHRIGGFEGAGCTVYENGGVGIRVGSFGVSLYDALVTGNIVRDNCDAAVGACAGIMVNGAGLLFGDVIITENLVTGTAGDPAATQGIGILLAAGIGHVVDENVVGGAGAAGNAGHGIAALSNLGTVSDATISDNTISGNGRNGVLLGSGSATCTVSGGELGTISDNAGNGIRIFGSDGHVVTGVRIHGNGLSGIEMAGSTSGDWHSGGVIENNEIGLTAGNAEHGIYSTGEEGGYTIRDNIVSGNGKNGVWLSDPAHLVDGNEIGVDASGTSAVPNGTDTSETWAGLRISASDVAVGGVSSNVISGNLGHGVWIEDPGDGSLVGAGILGNFIGTDALGATGVGNTGDGVRVEARDVEVGALGAGNRIAGNGGAGIHVVGSETIDTWGTTVVDNDIGSDVGGLGPAGNATAGVWIEQGVDDLLVWSHEVDSNRIYGNGTYGIHITGGATNAWLSLNSIAENGLCAIELVDSNGSIPAPKVTDVTGTEITGTIDAALEAFVSEVQVFADVDHEALDVLGSATVTGTSWSLSGSFPYALDEVRALVILIDDNTSELTEFCGDGCPASHAPCDDFEECTFEYCDATLGCITAPREEGWRCEDDDLCTGYASGGYDVCNGAGTCLSGATITDPQDPAQCPWATPCNAVTCEPDQGCLYHSKCHPADDALALCAPDDLDQDLSANQACDPCIECGFDDDGDGLPNDWETNGLDLDCDGTVDQNIVGANSGVLNVYVEIDYMADDCANPVHSHKPDQADIDAMELLFLDEAGIVLLLAVDDCIPEVEMVTLSAIEPPRDPDCTKDDFAVFDDLKAAYFTPERRGVYHYAIFGHSQAKQPYTQDAYDFYVDGITCHGNGKSAAEGEGDDMYIAKTVGDEEIDPFADLNSFIHELGHNLDLDHGGPAEDRNAKPNYQSIMNYLYQWRLEPDDGYGGSLPSETNFSREVLATLNETALDEGAGLLSFDAKYLVKWHCPPDSPAVLNKLESARSDGSPIDWTCDEEIEAAATGDVTLNGEPIDAAVTGAQDWGNLGFDFQCDGGDFQHGFDVDDPDMSLEEAERLGLRHPIRQVAVDIVPGCSANPVLVGVPGTVEVALLGDVALVLDEIVPSSLRFQGAHAKRAQRTDVNGDGILDLRLAFETVDLRLTLNSVGGVLTGQRPSGQRLHGREALTAYGTLTDADGDGVSDPCDQCPDTAAGVPVDDTGCP